MGSSGSRPSGSARRHTARFGLWRALVAAPAVIGSLPLLTLASGALGRWAGLLLLAWAAGAAVLMTRVGERITVRVVCRFQRPSPVQAAVLKPAWATALRVTGAAAGAVELYVQTARVPNAYAAGGRSVAVTSRVLEDYESGQLAEDQFVAVLVHELGHHGTGAARPMLLVSFLVAPWRLAVSLLTGLGSILAGRQPRRGVVIAVVVGLAVAVTRALFQGQWMVGGVLAFVGLEAVFCPLADAAISRRSEFAADRFAADHGLARELAAALHAMDGGWSVAAGWSRRLLASHPTSEQRIRVLLAATGSAESSARLRPRTGIVTGRHR
jgi:STE24 endopeptidase